MSSLEDICATELPPGKVMTVYGEPSKELKHIANIFPFHRGDYIQQRHYFRPMEITVAMIEDIGPHPVCDIDVSSMYWHAQAKLNIPAPKTVNKENVSPKVMALLKRAA